MLRNRSTRISEGCVGELIERQEFVVPRVVGESRRGALEQVSWCRPQSAVPHPKRIQGNVVGSTRIVGAI
jgi:hypothetical protein